jgi:hypothetical protein
MYDGFSDTDKHSINWVWITKEFLKLAFASSHREMSCSCSRCENRMMLSEYGMSAHLTKMEKIFLLEWFNAMQYLLVHLSWKDRVGGLAQFR